MTDLGQILLGNIEQRYTSLIRNDKRLKQIANRIRDGTSYEDANLYSIRAGELLSESLQKGTNGLAYMSREVAQEVLTPVLTDQHDLITTVTDAVQTNMNLADGIGISVQTPELDTNRINGLIEKISSYETLDEGRWVFNEPIINYSQAIVDEAIRDNARRIYKLTDRVPQIIRIAESSGVRSVKRGNKSYSYRVPCKWCKNLAGRWDYGEEPDDVFRRHESCRCIVTFVNGNKSQDVWSKAEWTTGDAEERSKVIQDRVREQEELNRLSTIERIMRLANAQ